MEKLKSAIVNSVREGGSYLMCANSKKTVYEIERRTKDIMVRKLKDAEPSLSMWGENHDIDSAISICPLDSPLNFSRDFGSFGVMSAYIREGIPVYGALYLPLQDELITAERGRGARLNGRRLVAGMRDDLGKALICCNCDLYTDSSVPPGVEIIEALARNKIGWRNSGSPAFEYASFALGRVDGIILPIQESGHAAGLLVMQEAGALVTDREGNPFSLYSETIVAANRNLHGQLLEALSNPLR